MRLQLPNSLRGRMVLVPAAIGLVLAIGIGGALLDWLTSIKRKTQVETLQSAALFLAQSSNLAVFTGNSEYLSNVALVQAMAQDRSRKIQEVAAFKLDEDFDFERDLLAICARGLAGAPPCSGTHSLRSLQEALIRELPAIGRENRWDTSWRIRSIDRRLAYVAPVTFKPMDAEAVNLVGFVVTIGTEVTFLDTLAENIKLLVFVSLVMLGLSLIIYWLLGRLVIWPIMELAASAREIAMTGEIGSTGIAPKAGDASEIAELVACFNAMTAKVRETNGNLKNLVDERTRALADTNADLTATLSRAEAYAAELTDAKAGLEGLNRDLITAVERAEEASRAKSEFLARMNHEIRNPLNAIIQRAEYLQELAEEEELDEFTEETTGIVTKSQHLLGVINRVLDMSKIESGKIEPEIHAREIDLLVEEVRDMAEPMVERNRSRLIIKTEDGLGEVVTDITMLRQCLLNLLSNSAKFTSKGEVRLEVNAVDRTEAEAHLGNRAGSYDDWISFAVIDTGIGMTPEELARVFAPFTQANDQISSHYGGTGLGLSLTQKFCQALGGDVFLESEKDVGTRAEILLPRVFENDGGTALVNRVAASGKARRILVIDDDTAFHEEIAAALSPLRADIHHARTADSGMTVCRALRPDAIVLDILMPMKDGYTFLKELRGEPTLSDIPVVIVTETEKTEAAEALGATGFFSKPLYAERMSALFSMVRNLLAGELPRRVLIVDDEDTVRRTLRRSFERHGAEVLEAGGRRPGPRPSGGGGARSGDHGPRDAGDGWLPGYRPDARHQGLGRDPDHCPNLQGSDARGAPLRHGQDERSAGKEQRSAGRCGQPGRETRRRRRRCRIMSADGERFYGAQDPFGRRRCRQHGHHDQAADPSGLQRDPGPRWRAGGRDGAGRASGSDPDGYPPAGDVRARGDPPAEGR